MTLYLQRALPLGALAIALPATALAEKIPVDGAGDLPHHRYRIEAKAVEVLNDDELLGKLAAELRADLLSNLEKYEVRDKTTLQEYYGVLGAIAMLEGRPDDFRRYRNIQAELEKREGYALTMGLFILSYLDAVESEAPDLEAAIAAELRERTYALPYDVVKEAIREKKGRAEAFSRSMMENGIATKLQPSLDRTKGKLSQGQAQLLVATGFSFRFFVPYRPLIAEVYGEYLSAHEARAAETAAE
jgi:hypothetical protein